MWKLNAKKSVLLMIDMQNDFVLEGYPMAVPMARARLGRMATLLEKCRALDIPVIYTQHILRDDFNISPLESTYNPMLASKGMRLGTDGIEIVDALKPAAEDIVIQKHRYDAFHNTPLETVLSTIRGLHTVDTLIIAGTLTEVCCESTARSGYMRDYKIAFSSDATGGLSDDAQRATLNNITQFFGRAITTSEIIQELTMGEEDGQ